MSGDHTVCPDLLDFVSRDVETDASIMKQIRKAGEQRHLDSENKEEEKWRLAAGQAALTLSRLLTLRVRSPYLNCFFPSSLATMVGRAARDLLRVPHFPSVELRDGHRTHGRSTQCRVQRRHHRVSLPVTVAQSCSLKAVADAVAHAGPVPEGIGWPGAISELRVARGYTDTPVHLAPLDVGALGLPSRGALTSWWVPVSLSRLSKVEAQWSSGLSQGYVDPRVGKCHRELLRALLAHGVIKFRKGSFITVRLEQEWRPTPHHRRAHPKHCFRGADSGRG